MNNKQLKDQIWITRVSRAKAEARLIGKESFIQGINIYYSVLIIIYSIMSYVVGDNSIGLVGVFLSIGLFASILYLNNQNYLDQAKEFRSNYIEMQRLEMELDGECDVELIKNRYCDLLKNANNHTEYDYLCALDNSDQEYKKTKNWSVLRTRLIWGKAWRCVVKAFIIFVPILLLIISEGLAR